MQPELIRVPDRLEGRGVLLRPYVADDAPAQWAAIEESRSYLRPWLTVAPGLRSLDEVRIANARDRAAWLTRERLVFGLFDRTPGQRYLGELALHHIDWDVPRFELGYWLRQSAQGRGYMREGVDLVTRCVFEQLGAQRIEARVDARNVRSQRLLQALGWQHEGTLRRYARDAAATLIDLDLYARIAA